jgi:hypothetical protein
VLTCCASEHRGALVQGISHRSHSWKSHPQLLFVLLAALWQPFCYLFRSAFAGTPAKMLRQQLQTTTPAQVKARPSGQALVATLRRRVRVCSSVDELIKPAAPSTPDAAVSCRSYAVLASLPHVAWDTMLCCTPRVALPEQQHQGHTACMYCYRSLQCSALTTALLFQTAVCTTQTRHCQVLQ